MENTGQQIEDSKEIANDRAVVRFQLIVHSIGREMTRHGPA
jgi:hypothetical protein